MLAQFTVRKPAEEARDKLMKAKQKGSVTEFVNYLRSQLVHVTDRSQEDILHLFKYGLKPQLRQALTIRDPKTFEEAATVAVEIEASMSGNDTSRRSASGAGAQLHQLGGDDYSDDSSNEDEDVNETETDNEAEDEEDLNLGYVERTAEEAEKLRKAGRCLRCAEKGHLARDCPKRDKSKKTKRGGHGRKKTSGDRR